MKTSLMLGLLASWFAKLMDFITGFFAFIPMSIYFVYASVASLLDFFQYVIRKLAGLDSYYVTIDGVTEEKQGDILVDFLQGILGINGSHGAQYQTLSTVFWSLVIFGVILVILTTIVNLIKSHYNYDAKKSHPMEIIKGSIKSLFTMALVPLVTVFGLYFSEIILNTLDSLTSASSGTSITALFGNEAQYLQETGTDRNGNKLYASFDYFGAGSPTNQTTFSGAMFKIASRDCNRVRVGSFRAKTSSDNSWTDFNIFLGDEETIAMRLDEAFASNIHIKNKIRPTMSGGDSWVLSSAYLVGGGAAFGAPMARGVDNFSKYDVGLIFYFYNLWGYNYFVAFAGVAAFITLFINIIMGLITRLLYCLALFLIYAPIVGIGPLDGNKAFGQWKKTFIENVLMAYGTVVGMNIFFLILPFFDSVKFFNVGILDQIMQILIMLAGLVLVKKFMALLSGFIGGADANSTGNDVTEGVKKIGMSGAKATMGAAKLGIAVGGLATKGKLGWALAPGAKGAAAGLKAIGKGVQNIRARKALGYDKQTWKGMSKGQKRTARQRFGARQALLKQKNVDKDQVKATFKNVANNTDEQNIMNISGLIRENNDAIYKRQGMSDDDIKKAREKEINEKGGETIHEGKNPEAETGFVGKAMKATGQALLDVGGSALKLAGDLSGITKFGKDLEETGGVFSAGKEAVQMFMQKTGHMQKDKDGKWQIPEGLMTKSQKDSADKASAAAQREAIEQQARVSRETLEKIKELTAAIQKNKIK